MQKSHSKFFIVLIAGIFFLTGCATTRAKKQDEAAAPVDPRYQVAELKAELQAKDLQIQELQTKLDSQERVPQTSYSTRSSSNFAGHTSNIIRVSGVTVEDVQKALIQAGLSPGPVDGRVGNKTKAAIKEFQRRHNLKADGVIGERTWSYLKS